MRLCDKFKNIFENIVQTVVLDLYKLGLCAGKIEQLLLKVDRLLGAQKEELFIGVVFEQKMGGVVIVTALFAKKLCVIKRRCGFCFVFVFTRKSENRDNHAVAP